MKKIIIIVILLIIMGAGYYYITSKDKVTEIKVETGADKGLVVKENTTLMGWLRRGKEVECTINTAEGEILAQTKDLKVRIEGEDFYRGEEDGGEKGVFLNDGEYIYIWSGQEGMKINIKEMENMTETMEEEPKESYSWIDSVDQWEDAEYQYSCREKKLSDDLFIPPQDINFVDFSDFAEGLESMTEEMESLNKELQEGLGEGEVLTQEEIEEKLEEMDIDLNKLMNN
ncbi:hypothetical protein ACFLZ9_00230 [Patescibacteria group bacterium]